jgi:hypothetical protein
MNLVNNNYQTNGGLFGHCLRRIIHLGMIAIPIIYYWYSNTIFPLLKLTIDQWVSLIAIFAVIFEIIRIHEGWLFIGQRSYEKKQISSVTWTTFSIAIVLLTAPKIGYMHAAIGAPLIWSLSIVDPLLGELRKHTVSKNFIYLIGFIVITSIWCLAAYWLLTPWLLVPFIIPITLFAEQLKIIIDDNALILLMPLATVFLLMPWIS